MDRVREVGGFDLNQLKRVTPISFPTLPSSIPLIYARGRRLAAFKPLVVALSLYQLIDRRTGMPRFADRASLCEYFGIDRTIPIVLSGTDHDASLERWWSLEESRVRILSTLASMGVVAATTPNFSVFSDVPRWDNFHAMMRIGICWQEMTEAGIPTALHVNARAQHDWSRWTTFVQQRSEVSAIAYEFATGAAGPTRMTYHVDELRHLADRAGRPLTLITRGALSALSELRKSFASVSMLDSTTYMRTVNRKAAVLQENGRLQWKPCSDRPNVNLDELIEHNYLTMLRAAAR